MVDTVWHLLNHNDIGHSETPGLRNPITRPTDRRMLATAASPDHIQTRQKHEGALQKARLYCVNEDHTNG